MQISQNFSKANRNLQSRDCPFDESCIRENGHAQVSSAMLSHYLGAAWEKCGPASKAEADPESAAFGVSQDGKFFLEGRSKRQTCMASTTVKVSALTSLSWDYCRQLPISGCSLCQENETTNLFSPVFGGFSSLCFYKLSTQIPLGKSLVNSKLGAWGDTFTTIPGYESSKSMKQQPGRNVVTRQI